MTCAPFISHTAALPLVSRQVMSLLPLPLKSWVSVSLLLAETSVAEAHGDVALLLLLCVKTTAGSDSEGGTAEACTKNRLFVSPVKPWPRQEGAVVFPESTLVLTTIVDPLLKVALDRQQSPTMLNSAACQPCARLRMPSSFCAE